MAWVQYISISLSSSCQVVLKLLRNTLVLVTDLRQLDSPEMPARLRPRAPAC